MLYEVGCHKVDVTPPVGVWLAGYAARTEPSKAVYHPLRAVTTVIGDGQTDVLLVSIEWLGFYDLTEEARRRISEACGIPRSHIILCGTHTHCGPAVRDVDVRRHGEDAIDGEYVDRTLDALAEAALSAVESRRPAHLGTGSEWCGFAASRRKPDGNGGVLWEPSLDAPHDHEVPVLVVSSPDGALRQTIFSYACHPTSTGPILEIGGDYPGFACAALESRYPGVVASFLKGCGGDQKPDPAERTTGTFRRIPVEEVKVLGSQLGSAVARVVDLGPLDSVDGAIKVAQTFVTLEADPVTESAIAEARDSEGFAAREWADHYSGAMEAGDVLSTRVSMEIQTVRFGNSLVLVTMAGEINVEYGLRLKRELGKVIDWVIPLGYANEIVGYVPVERQIPEGGYEVVGNAQGLLYSGPFSSGTEDRIVDAAWSLLEDPPERVAGD